MDGDRESLVAFRVAMAAAYTLGHATRVEKQFEGGYFPGPALYLHAAKAISPDWICDCGETNHGLASCCKHCEQDRPSQPPDWAMTPDTAEATS